VWVTVLQNAYQFDQSKDIVLKLEPLTGRMLLGTADGQLCTSAGCSDPKHVINVLVIDDVLHAYTRGICNMQAGLQVPYVHTCMLDGVGFLE